MEDTGVTQPPPPAARADGDGEHRGPDGLSSLPTAARTRWRIEGSVLLAVLAMIAAAPFVVLAWLAFDAAPVVLVAIVIVAGLAGVALGLQWANRRYARFGYHLDDERLRVRDGVIIHSDAVAPLFRVQHVDLTRGPIQLAFDLATLSIHTASPAADIELPDLRTADAERLRDEILTASRDAAAALGVGDVDAV